jgi:hypothetical protein
MLTKSSMTMYASMRSDRTPNQRAYKYVMTKVTHTQTRLPAACYLRSWFMGFMIDRAQKQKADSTTKTEFTQ